MMQNFVAYGSKKRTVDMITKDDNTQIQASQVKELSPIEHVHNYFKRLKKARDDDIGDEEESQ